MDEAEIREQVRRVLEKKKEAACSTSAAMIVRIAFDIIEGHIQDGLTLAEIADALKEHGFLVSKGHLVRHLGRMRAARGLEPLHRGRPRKLSNLAPGRPAGEERGAKEAATPSPSTEPVAPAPPVMTVAQRLMASTAQAQAVRHPAPAPKEVSFVGVPVDQLPPELQALVYVEINGEKLDVRPGLPNRYTVLKRDFAARPRMPAPDEMAAVRAESEIQTRYADARRTWYLVAEKLSAIASPAEAATEAA